MLNLLDCIHIDIARKYSERIRINTFYNVKINTLSRFWSAISEKKIYLLFAEKLNIKLKHLNRICNEILQKTAQK